MSFILGSMLSSGAGGLLDYDKEQRTNQAKVDLELELAKAKQEMADKARKATAEETQVLAKESASSRGAPLDEAKRRYEAYGKESGDTAGASLGIATAEAARGREMEVTDDDLMNARVKQGLLAPEDMAKFKQTQETNKLNRDRQNTLDESTLRLQSAQVKATESLSSQREAAANGTGHYAPKAASVKMSDVNKARDSYRKDFDRIPNAMDGKNNYDREGHVLYTDLFNAAVRAGADPTEAASAAYSRVTKAYDDALGKDGFNAEKYSANLKQLQKEAAAVLKPAPKKEAATTQRDQANPEERTVGILAKPEAKKPEDKQEPAKTKGEVFPGATSNGNGPVPKAVAKVITDLESKLTDVNSSSERAVLKQLQEKIKANTASKTDVARAERIAKKYGIPL